MNKNQFCSLLLASALVAGFSLFQSAAAADDGGEIVKVTMCTVPFAPLYGPDLPRQGFITALTRAAFNVEGIKTELEFMPWARAMQEVKLGNCDMLMGAYYSDARAKTYIASKPMYIVRLGLIARNDVPIHHFDSLKDLKPYSIGITRGYSNGKRFDNAKYLDKQEEDTPVLNVRKLYAGRLDMAVLAYSRFQFIVRKHDLDLSKVHFVNPVLKSSNIVQLASRAIPNGQLIIKKFNEGLRKIQSDGTYSQTLTDMGY